MELNSRNISEYFNKTRAGKNKGNPNTIFSDKNIAQFEHIKTRLITDICSEIAPQMRMADNTLQAQIKQYQILLDSIINTKSFPQFQTQMKLLKLHSEKIYPRLFPEINVSEYQMKDMAVDEFPEIIRQRLAVLEKMEKHKPKFVVVTVTKNRQSMNDERLRYLQQNFDSMAQQKSKEPFFWLVIDNTSTDGTKQFLDGIEHEDFVGRLDFNAQTGAPFAARNFGVDFIAAALQFGAIDNKSFVLRVDSDDQLFDEFVLANLSSLHKKQSSKSDALIIRGQQLNVYEDKNGEVERYGREPHFINQKSYPGLHDVTDILDAGLPFGSYSSLVEAYNKYPEITIIEDAFKVRLDWILATSRGKDVVADDIITVKRRFHPNSDTSSHTDNSKKDNPLLLGEYEFTGDMRTAFDYVVELNNRLYEEVKTDRQIFI